jgi:hypothetical protein
MVLSIIFLEDKQNLIAFNNIIKEIYVIFIHLFDSRILLIIDLNKKKGTRGEDFIVNFTVKYMLCFDSLKRKIKVGCD